MQKVITNLLPIFFVLVFVGCATTLSDMDRAIDHCSKNGGLAEIQSKYNSTIRATCNNGAKFTLTYKDVQ